VQALEEAMGLAPRDEREGRVEGQLATDIGLVELVIMPRSKLVGRTLQEARFGDRFGVTVVSIKRGERRLRDRVSRTVLRFGDALLVAGPWARIALLRRERREFLVVTEPEEAKEAAETPEREGLAIAVVVAMLVAMALGWVPVVIASLAAALAMVLGGAVRVPMVYRSISGPSVVLVAAMLPVATALEASGAIDTIVGGLEAWTVGRPAAVALLLLMLLTSLLSQVISNTATSVLLAPVGVELARALGIDPAPLLLGLAVAASSAFTTPMASPVNTLVLGPGNYRFVDYVRAGVPLQILTVLGGWAAIAWTM
jgi:di/tricarboxylate transporter